MPGSDVQSVVSRLRAAGCVFAEDEARLLIAAAGTPADLDSLVDRRAAGLPLEQVLGWAQFSDLRVTVEPGVFVPRRRTEFLVDQAAAVARRAAADMGRPAVVVDLGCGSGAIGAAIRTAVAGVELHAVDIDPVAVHCARRNLVGPETWVYEGDLYEPLPTRLRGRVDVLVANAPYVPTHAVSLMPPEARVHEPRIALDGGPDGLDVLRRLISDAPRWLVLGGAVLFEAGESQVPAALDAVARAGLEERVMTSTEYDATVVIGTQRT